MIRIDSETTTTVDAGAAETPKPRKARTPKEKAPSRKDNPAGYELHYLRLAIENIKKRDERVGTWGLPSVGDQTVSQHFTDALFSLSQVAQALSAVPADFKAPRKRGGGGGRKAKVFTAGQVVKLSDRAMELVKQIFPDYGHDCEFRIYDKMIISEGTKLYSVGTTGLGGALPWSYVGFYAAKDLTPVE